jgi:hypothetical protein
MFEWNIQSRAHACHATGRPFTRGESFHTALLQAREGLERLDLSAPAWREQSAEILSRPGFVSHWVTTYEPPPATPPEAIRRDDAEALLRALLARREPRHEGAAFVLAAMLERKRLVRVKGHARDDGRRVTLYEHPRSGDVLAVVDPGLKLADLESVQRDVATLLEQGLPDAAPQPGEAAHLSAEPAPMEEPFNPPSEIPTLAPA